MGHGLPSKSEVRRRRLIEEGREIKPDPPTEPRPEGDNIPAPGVCPKCGRQFNRTFVPYFHKVKCG